MDCVACSRTLEPAEHEGVPIDQCPDGHGVWLDSGELRLIVESERAPRPAAEREAAIEGREPSTGAATTRHGRPCPVCRTPMELVRYDETSGIEIETCLDHGVWLDSGELERAEAWIEANRAQSSPTRARLAEEHAENMAELDAAYAAGEGWGPLGRFVAMLHYARHSDDARSDRWGANAETRGDGA